MKQQQKYELRLRTLVGEAVDRGAGDFETLVGELPGIFPLTVVDILRSLQLENQRKELQDLLEQADTENEHNGWSRTDFVPHPLDSDWRFTPACADSIAHEIGGLVDSPASAHVALLGTPTLVPAVRQKMPAARIWLVDKNPRWEAHFAPAVPQVVSTTIELDSNDLPRNLRKWADVVAIDAPWYQGAYEHFLWAAAEVSKSGAWLLATLPREGTRPSAQDDIRKIVHFARTVGFSPTQQRQGAVRYRTPPFEFNAMRAGGMKMRLPEWRTADLLLLRAESQCQVKRPPIARHVERWEECNSGAVRVKFRVERNGLAQAGGSPRLLSLVPGDILPSVSFRHPIRPDIDVWTSGNRVFRCENTRALAAICAELNNSNNLDLARVVSARLCRPLDNVVARDLPMVASHLRELLNLEQHEYGEEE